MASTIKIKRSSVAAKVPTTADINSGELALNITDRKLYSSNGTTVFEIGTHKLSVSNAAATYQTKAIERSALANTNLAITNVKTGLTSTNTALRTLISDRLQVANAATLYTTKSNPTTSGLLAHTGRATISTNLNVSGNTVIGKLVANGSLGTSGYALKTNGSTVYWDAVGAGGAAGATWAALTSTNTALRTLISDRLQVANASATYQTKAVERAALANTNSAISNVKTGLTSTNTAIRTLVSDRLQVANAAALYTTKSNPTTSGLLAHTGRATISTNLAVSGNTTISSTLGVTGVATFAAGTALLPALTTSGDTNTGVWFPAADTLAASTAGSERIRITSAGNVGIGTASPDGKLDIATGGTTDVVAALGGTFPAFTYRNGTGLGTWFHAGKHPSSDYFYIGRGATPTYAVDVVVNGSGNVGIGTTAPANKFEVFGNSVRNAARASTTAGEVILEAQAFDYWSAIPTYTGTSLRQSGSTATGTTAGLSNASLGSLYFQNSSAGLITTNGATPLVFATTSTERMRIDSSGNVGIGTTAPGAKLGVNAGALGTSDGNQLEKARFSSTTGNAIHLRIFTERDGAGSNWETAFTRIQQRIDVTDMGYIQFNGAGNQYGLSFGKTNTEYMRISSGGLVTACNSMTVGKNLSVSGNTVIGKLVANGSLGTSGYVLKSNGSTVYWGQISPTAVVSSLTQNDVVYTTSDYRLKENVLPMVGGLNNVMKLNPVEYTWKDNGSSGQGFIAHELQSVVPDSVIGQKDEVYIEKYEISPHIPATYDERGNPLTPEVDAVFGEREIPKYQSIDKSFLVAILTSAIQEQQTIIESLTNRIAALESK